MSLLKVRVGGSRYLCKWNPRNSVVIGGRRYPVVKIGNQFWMAENLDYKFDVNGGTLPIGVSGSPTTPAAWYYDNDESAYGIDGTYRCGLLYNWYAVNYLATNESTLLPNGWHVPSLSDWNTLLNFIGNSNRGTKLKAKDNSVTSDWPSNWNGTNDYEFNVTPAGVYGGTFVTFGFGSSFWTNYDSTASTEAYLSFGTGANCTTATNYKRNAYSVRLIKY